MLKILTVASHTDDIANEILYEAQWLTFSLDSLQSYTRAMSVTRISNINQLKLEELSRIYAALSM